MIKKFLLFSLLFIPYFVFAQDIWEQTNGPYGGTVSSIAVCSKGTLFAGNEAGIFKSTDNGDNWFSAGLMQYGLKALAVSQDGVVVAAFRYQGIYRMAPGDLSWTRIVVPDQFNQIETLAIDPNGSIYFAYQYSNGLFRSTDDGNTWIKIDSTIENITEISIDAKGNIFVTSNWSLYRSIDNGVTWTKISIGLLDGTIFQIGFNKKGQVFAGTRQGLFYSNDEGLTWQRAGTLNSLVYKFAINSKRVIVAAFLTEGLLISSNNGETWMPTDYEVNNNDIYQIAASPKNDFFMAVERNGIYHSTNAVNWFTVNNGLREPGAGMVGANVLAVSNDGTIFNAGYDQLSVSTDRGNTWTSKYSYKRGGFIMSLSTNKKNDVFLSVANYGLLRSTNKGNDWTSLSGINQYAGVENIFIKPDNNYIFLYTYSQGKLRSTDNGDSWISFGYPWIVMASNDSGYVFGGGGYSGFNVSTDNGVNWQNMGVNLVAVYGIYVNHAGVIFVVTWWSSIYRSTDNGKTWTILSLDSPLNQVSSLVFNSLDEMFLSTRSGGVYKSKNNGESWCPFNKGLKDLNVYDLAISSDDYLYAQTSNSGVFRTKVSSIPVGFSERTDIKLSEYSLAQNYPNPFNPTTKIKYSLAYESKVIIDVYNIMGEKVVQLVNDTQEPGDYSIELNNARLSSGVYIYEMSAVNQQNKKNFKATKKMIVLK